MFGLDSTLLFLIAMGASALLYFVLAWYKKYAYYWWALGGMAVCIPIVMVIPKLTKFLKENNYTRNPSINVYIFLTIYLVVYIALWIFVQRSELTEKERQRRDKLDAIMFDGFFAIKENRLKEAYSLFRKGYLLDPDNPVIKVILSNFHDEKGELTKKGSLTEWFYQTRVNLKHRLFFKKKEETQIEVVQENDKKVGVQNEEKIVEGKVVD